MRQLARVPEVSLYRDGRLIRHDPEATSSRLRVPLEEIRITGQESRGSWPSRLLD